MLFQEVIYVITAGAGTEDAGTAGAGPLLQNQDPSSLNLDHFPAFWIISSYSNPSTWISFIVDKDSTHFLVP